MIVWLVGLKVGSFTGYSAIKMGQVMPPGCRVVSFETDFKWLMVAKRWGEGRGSHDDVMVMAW